MKKIYSVLIAALCCLLVFTSCGFDPYGYYVNRALKIDVECVDYSLKPVSDLKGGEDCFILTPNNYVTKEYLLNPDNDENDVEFYNEGFFVIYMHRRKLSLFKEDEMYTLDSAYFRDHSKTYNLIENIWIEKYNVTPSEISDTIVGAAVFDGNVFILAQNRNAAQASFDREHTANLWKFDVTSGELAFCGFCVSKNGAARDLHFFEDNLAIVKNA